MSIRIRHLIQFTFVSLLLSTCTMQESKPSSWEPVLVLDQSPPFSSSLSAAFSSGDIWAVIVRTVDDKRLIRYSPSLGILTQYTVEGRYGKGIPLNLFESRNGTLWGWGFQNETRPLNISPSDWSYRKEWMLSRYDQKSNTFVQIHDADGLLICNTATGLTEDTQGALWIIESDIERIKNDAHYRNKIIRYDPSTNHSVLIDLDAKLQELLIRNVWNLAGAPDSTIWFVGEPSERAKSSRQKSETAQTTVIQYDRSFFSGRMLRYDPKNDLLTDYGMPPGGMEYLDSAFFDGTGRLWLSSIAWMDFPKDNKPVWHPLIRPQAFVGEIKTLNGPSSEWLAPYAMYESSDELIWFSTESGLVVYDRKTDSWRRMNDWNSALVEDQKHFLWTAADGQLYRYKLK